MKKRRHVFLLFIVPLFMISCTSTQKETSLNNEHSTPDESASIYEKRSMQGFQVFVEKRAFSENDSLTNQALVHLEEQLTTITTLPLKPAILAHLKSVSLFVDWNTVYGGAVYHPSEEWLVENAYFPGKAESIEISNLQNFLAWSKQNQPFMILHEFSHAYHHQVVGFEDSRITDAFNNALSEKLYRNVKLHNGNEEYSNTETAYALSNFKEYFAELSEAYFGRNDIFPFNKEELKDYDPLGYEMIESVWQQQ